jgi:hypothetical protein
VAEAILNDPACGGHFRRGCRPVEKRIERNYARIESIAKDVEHVFANETLANDQLSVRKLDGAVVAPSGRAEAARRTPIDKAATAFAI